MFAYVTSLILAFLLGFFLEATMGLVGFWFLEISSLLFVYMLFNFFFSGHMFPLTMLPAPWDTIMQIIPLQYLAFFPAAVFLQKISGPALWWGLAIQGAWVVFFIALCRITYARGVRRYSGFGG
jgi:ABC-2 type transport system permease protein